MCLASEPLITRVSPCGGISSTKNLRTGKAQGRNNHESTKNKKTRKTKEDELFFVVSCLRG
jgi:hypothetical protein